MLYLLANVFNFRQLEKLQNNLVFSIREAFHRIRDLHKQVVLNEYNEIIFMELGPETIADPQNILDISFNIKEILDQEQENLFGYNILIINSGEKNSQVLLNQYKSVFLSLEKDNCIWICRNLMTFFRRFAEFEVHGDYQVITQKKIIARVRTGDSVYKKLPLGSRETLFSTVMPLVNHEVSYQAVHFYGPAGAGKSMILTEVIESIYPAQFASFVPRNHVRFKKSSCVHPLLNSVNIDFLDQVPGYLQHHSELNTWKEHKSMLHYLKSVVDIEKCPDHVFEDFYLAYQLYIAAYSRMMSSNFYPAFFICDDLDKYHEKTVQYLSLLINDFIGISTFIPIFISQKSSLPGIFNDLVIKRIKTSCLDVKEIMNITDLKFPQLKLNNNIYKGIRSNTQGQITPVLLNLLYLDLREKRGRSLVLQEKFDNVLRYIINNLDKTARDILFSIYLSGGLLPVAELENFLTAFGLKKNSIHEYFDLLSSTNLIFSYRYLVPCFPAYRLNLEKQMGKRGIYLKGLISDFIVTLWKEKKLANLVLLFSFFMNNSLPEYAFEILSLLIKRKIDEHDFPGVKPFLILNNFSFPGGLNQQESHLLNIIVTSGKIRLQLLENDLKSVRYNVAAILESESRFLSDKFHGKLKLNIARFYIVEGELENAIQLTKKTLLICQELENRSLTGQAYFMLGYIMLLRGKLNDAIDYFILADKLLDENYHPYEINQVLMYGATAYFIKGELAKSLDLVNRGLKTAALAARRDCEFFFSFLKARIYFEYGFYDKAIVQFQKNLSLAAVYRNQEVISVNYSWMARTKVYTGRYQEGIQILEQLPENRETLFFRSEVCYFQEKIPEAREILERALQLPVPPPVISDEIIDWIDGFHSLEGRCLPLESSGSCFNRLLRAFYAFLQGIENDVKAGIDIMHRITRIEKYSGQDPYSHFYYYLYALLLYMNKSEDTEDSLTILNKAIKQLQERASKIDEPLARTRYLNQNYWNNKLLAEGRKRKLLF